MLKQLAVNDVLWRKISFRICKDKDTADEMTQEMYLRFEKLKSDDPKYIYSILRNIYYDTFRTKEICEDDFNKYNLPEEVNDIGKDFFKTKEEFEELLEPLNWFEKKIYQLSNEHGQRKLSRLTGINLKTIHNTNKKVKNEIRWQIINERKYK